MESNEKDLDYFIDRFNELATDAKEHGLGVVVLLESADPIAGQAGYSRIFRGTQATIFGMLHMALMER